MGKSRFNQDPGPLKRFEPKTKPLPKPHIHVGLTLALATVITIGVLQAAGVIDITGLLNPSSPKYLDVPGIFHPEPTPTPGDTTTKVSWWEKFLSLFAKESKSCPKTTAEMSTHCCKTETDINTPQTSAVEVPASCSSCPSDTTAHGIAPHTSDFTAKYGQYKLCICNPCKN
jgi:hypothetical protein